MNINLFPYTTKPLNVFEPRYVEMIHKSVQNSTPIALCFVPEGSSEIRPVAGFGIPQIIEHRPDKSLFVFLAGKGKVLLDLQTLSIDNSLSVMSGSVISENLDLDEGLRSKYVSLSEVLVRWVSRHVTDKLQREVFFRNLSGPREVVGAFAAYLIYDYDLQYEVMEITSLNEQIQFLYRLLESGKLTNV